MNLDIPCVLQNRFDNTLKQLAVFEDTPNLAVAVSGGPDSLALLKLTCNWAQRHRARVVAFHIDHKLRTTSTSEAHQVKSWCEAWNVQCEILTWNHGSINTKIQETARSARYHLFENACQEKGILHLLLGHHHQDVVETVHMRSEKKSGPIGMAGISACMESLFVRFLRPVLNFTKDELLRVLAPHPFITDPSNKNLIFHRARLRETLQSQTSEIKKILCLNQNKRIETEERITHDLSKYVQLDSSGWVNLPKEDLIFESQYQNFLFWAHLLRCIGGKSYLANNKVIERLLKELQNSSLKKFTCSGCIIINHSKSYTIFREWGRIIPYHFSHNKPFLWDNRFFVDSIHKNVLDSNVFLKPLGWDGWAQIKQWLPKNSFEEHLLALPTLWKNDQVVEVIHLGIYQNLKPLVYLQFRPLNAMLDKYFVTLEESNFDEYKF